LGPEDLLGPRDFWGPGDLWGPRDLWGPGVKYHSGPSCPTFLRSAAGQPRNGLTAISGVAARKAGGLRPSLPFDEFSFVNPSKSMSLKDEQNF
jgi:hypothetical protein